MTVRTIVDRTLRLVAAAILFQTLFFKFTAAEESVFIFTTLGLEPWGRIGSGVAEAIAVVLLLVPRTVVFGAGLSLAVIGGAIVSHLTRLGIEVRDDGGTLFFLACVVFASSAVVLWLRRGEIPWIGPRLGGPGPGTGSADGGPFRGPGGGLQRVAVGGSGDTHAAPGSIASGPAASSGRSRDSETWPRVPAHLTRRNSDAARAAFKESES